MMKIQLYIFVFVALVIHGLTGNLRAQEMPEQVGHDVERDGHDMEQIGHDVTSVHPDQSGGLSAEAVVDFALEHNPGVRIAEWQQLNARRELNTAKWQMLPSVGLYAGWNTSYYSYLGSATSTFRNQFRNNMGEYVQISLSIPLWDRMAKASRISKKRHALKGYSRTGSETKGC